MWAGAEGQPLEEIHGRVDSALARLGHEEEKRAFHPHLTLGRARRGASPAKFRGLDDAFAGVDFDATFRARSVDVMRSHLKPTGAEYDMVSAVALEG